MTTTYMNEEMFESDTMGGDFSSITESDVMQWLGSIGELVKCLLSGDVKIEDVIKQLLKNEKLRVNRGDYLSSAFMAVCDEETIRRAIITNPAKAGIPAEIVDKVAKAAINKQTTEVVTMSVVLGSIPGGGAMDMATTGIDMIQYYGKLLVLAQKLLYLYGFPEIDLESEQGLHIDDATMTMILITLGTMFSIDRAAPAMRNIANMLAIGVEKKMMKQALTKSAIWPVMSAILSYFSINLTKDLACKTTANMIKFIGGIAVGGITLYTFSRCAENLRRAISDTALSNPASSNFSEADIIDIEALTPETLSLVICPAFVN